MTSVAISKIGWSAWAGVPSRRWHAAGGAQDRVDDDGDFVVGQAAQRLGDGWRRSAALASMPTLTPRTSKSSMSRASWLADHLGRGRVHPRALDGVLLGQRGGRRRRRGSRADRTTRASARRPAPPDGSRPATDQHRRLLRPARGRCRLVSSARTSSHTMPLRGVRKQNRTRDPQKCNKIAVWVDRRRSLGRDGPR